MQRSAALLTLLLAACADSIDRDALDALPGQITPRYGFRYQVEPEVLTSASLQSIGAILDADFALWSGCMEAHYGLLVTPELARSFRYVIVPREFECTYHPWYCGGEYDRDAQRVILAYETPAGAPMLYDWHEWSDLYQPETEDKSGRHCTRDL